MSWFWAFFFTSIINVTGAVAINWMLFAADSPLRPAAQRPCRDVAAGGQEGSDEARGASLDDLGSHRSSPAFIDSGSAAGSPDVSNASTRPSNPNPQRCESKPADQGEAGVAAVVTVGAALNRWDVPGYLDAVERILGPDLCQVRIRRGRCVVMSAVADEARRRGYEVSWYRSADFEDCGWVLVR